MDEKKVSKKYLELRNRVLTYSNADMNLQLENDQQIYIAVFDIPSNTRKRVNLTCSADSIQIQAMTTSGMRS